MADDEAPSDSETDGVVLAVTAADALTVATGVEEAEAPATREFVGVVVDVAADDVDTVAVADGATDGLADDDSGTQLLRTTAPAKPAADSTPPEYVTVLVRNARLPLTYEDPPPPPAGRLALPYAPPPPPYQPAPPPPPS